MTTAAFAESINGGWSVNNGDLLILLQSKKGVVGVDISENKQLRYVLQGSFSGNALSLKNQDGTISLEATVSEDTLQGTLTESASVIDFTASLSFAYQGSSYDGLWQIDGGQSYLAYATMKLKGVKTVIVPYFALNANQTAAYNLFIGQAATNSKTGAVSHAGISVLDLTTTLILKFSSTSAANGSFTGDDTATSFKTAKIKAVPKK